MQHGRKVAVLGGVRIPFCRQNTAYADVGNLGLSVRALGALVEKFGLQGQPVGEVAMGAVIKHSSDWNLGREAALSSGLSPLTPGITLQRACGTSLDTIMPVSYTHLDVYKRQGQAKRVRARQQAMQDHAQLPEIGGGGDGCIVQLFGRCIFEGQRAIERNRGFDIGQLFGDAEVEQLHAAVGIHQ